MMAVSVKISGIKELQNKFKDMSETIPKEIATNAAKESGELFNSYAKANVISNFTMRSWALYNSFKVVVTKAGNVRAGTYGIKYARIHEYGGVIKPKRSKVLFWVDNRGTSHFIKSATIPARPYIRPAYDEHKDDIIKTMNDVIYDYLKGL